VNDNYFAGENDVVGVNKSKIAVFRFAPQRDKADLFRPIEQSPPAAPVQIPVQTTPPPAAPAPAASAPTITAPTITPPPQPAPASSAPTYKQQRLLPQPRRRPRRNRHSRRKSDIGRVNAP